MDIQSNFNFQKDNSSSNTDRLNLSKFFEPIKSLLLAKATEEERRNELDDYEILQFGVQKDKV